MGVLRARIRPAERADQADHARVECDGGRVWGCLAEASGGPVLRSGRGSTRRADAIAGADGRAGIRGYLINGISHQLANRILLPAGITVRGAHGYGVSEALFGVYGRPHGSSGACPAPFERFPDIDGDLPECADAASDESTEDADPHALAAAEFHDPLAAPMNHEGRETFALAGFVLMLQNRLGTDFTRTEQARAAADARLWFEQAREPVEQGLIERPAEWAALCDAFDDLTAGFLQRMEKILSPRQYVELLDLEPGQPLTLVDRDIVRAEYAPA